MNQIFFSLGFCYFFHPTVRELCLSVAFIFKPAFGKWANHLVMLRGGNIISVQISLIGNPLFLFNHKKSFAIDRMQ